MLEEASFLGVDEFVLTGATHDSRQVAPGSTFFAILGKKCDGHAFVADAINRGARVVFIDSSKRGLLDGLDLTHITVVLVASAEQALYRLASAWRQKFVIPIIGVTGTMGKTTTKELLVHLFGQVGHVCHSSPGNMNTLIGLSLALLGLREEHRIAVFELGISHPGEMQALAALVQPTLAIITTLGHQHMDGLHSLRAIAHEKKQIFSCFAPDNIGFVHGDLPLLNSCAYRHPVVKFGFKVSNQVHARRVRFVDGQLHAVLRVFDQAQPITLAVPHRGYLTSVLAVAAVGYMLDISIGHLCAAIESFQMVEGRFFAKKSSSGACLVINDAYNANPESMREALLALDKMPGYSQKIAILGDMLGLGEQSVFWHRQVGRMLRNTKSISRVVFVGSHIMQAAKTMPHIIPYTHVATWEDVTSVLPASGENSVVLLKASRGVGLNNLVPLLG